MAVLPDRDVERALAIVAHPDDAEFWAGGTIARWTDAGIEVTYCVLTDGDGGGFDPAIPRADIPAIRRAEQHDAADHARRHRHPVPRPARRRPPPRQPRPAHSPRADHPPGPPPAGADLEPGVELAAVPQLPPRPPRHRHRRPDRHLPRRRQPLRAHPSRRRRPARLDGGAKPGCSTAPPARSTTTSTSPPPSTARSRPSRRTAARSKTRKFFPNGCAGGSPRTPQPPAFPTATSRKRSRSS